MNFEESKNPSAFKSDNEHRGQYVNTIEKKIDGEFHYSNYIKLLSKSLNGEEEEEEG